MIVFKAIRTSPKVDRVLLGLGLTLLAVFSGAVVWMFFGKGNLVTDSITVLLAVFSLIAIVQRWRGKIRLGFGLRGGAPLREFLVGFAICALAMAGLFSVEWALGAIRVEEISPDVFELVRTFTQDAVFQEVLFRVLLLSGMIALFRRPWLALGLSSILFALMHITGEGATALSVLGNTLDGLVYGLPLVLIGRIWMPIGLHAAWNWVQGPVFGFPVSGVTDYSNLLVHQVGVGSDLITGGAYGPEGGVVALAVRLVAIALVVLAMRRALGGPQDAVVPLWSAERS